MSPEHIKKNQTTSEVISKADSIDKAYSSEPWWYDARGLLILTFTYRSTLFSQIRFFSPNIGANHLEVAIGSGSLFDLILKWRKFKKLPIHKITAFDYADSMLNGARHRFAKAQNLTLTKADAAHLPWDSFSFDTANAVNCIHCFPEVEQSLKEIYRVLKPGGTFAGNCLLYPKGTTPLDWVSRKINEWGTKKGILNRPYYKNEIKSYLENTGFTIIQENVGGNCYDFLARKM